MTPIYDRDMPRSLQTRHKRHALKIAGIVGLATGAGLLAMSALTPKSNIPSVAQITLEQIAPDAQLPEMDPSGLSVGRASRTVTLYGSDSNKSGDVIRGVRGGVAWRSEYSGKSGHLHRTVMCVQFAEPKLGGGIDLKYAPVPKGASPGPAPKIRLDNDGRGTNELVVSAEAIPKNTTVKLPKKISLTNGLACFTVNYSGPAIDSLYVHGYQPYKFWQHPNPGTAGPDRDPTFQTFNDEDATRLTPRIAQAAQRQSGLIPKETLKAQVRSLAK